MERIGDYEIRFEIGKGGFGHVYLGFDPRVGRPVAIKILNADEDVVTRFRAEAKAAGNLTHPNIVTIYSSGEENGRRNAGLGDGAGALESPVAGLALVCHTKMQIHGAPP